METKRILRSIYNLNKKSKSVSDIDAKKQAFDKIDTIKGSSLSKIDLSDEDNRDTDRLLSSTPNGSRLSYYIFYTKHHTKEVIRFFLYMRKIFNFNHTCKILI
jgi:hypothetical protein